MKKYFFLMIMAVSVLYAQSDFGLDAYNRFLSDHADIDYSGLQQMHPQRTLLPGHATPFSDALCKDEIVQYFGLNEDENAQLEAQGFMVTNRVHYRNFVDAFHIIYKRDLPVYISSDAILYPLHKSYDNLLKTIEREVLFGDLEDLLIGMHSELNTLYNEQQSLTQNFKDLDLYLVVALRLLKSSASPIFDTNIDKADLLMQYIEAEKPQGYPLFSSIFRTIDFSQFTPRGHYTESAELTAYFQTMMWLGKTELFLVPPKSLEYNLLTQAQKDTLGQRQATDAYIISELLKDESLKSVLNEINEIIGFLVGESDNVLPDQLTDLANRVGFSDYRDLQSMTVYQNLRDTLTASHAYGQKILSQILTTDPMSPDKIEPAIAFLLLGQRFVIDSFILGNVVHDKVEYRVLPKSADLLFAMGNNEALPLLQEDLESYKYAPNLASLRYLLDHYDNAFWESTYFNLWLNVLRSLNPAIDDSIPALINTRAWSRKTMNTQLASWAQLRHDNILYAKQSYTGGMGCSYPYGFVEPVPRFYAAVKLLADKAAVSFAGLAGLSEGMRASLDGYFANLSEIMASLQSLAEKEIAGVSFSEADTAFLADLLYEENICGITFSGWYQKLFYFGMTDLGDVDYVVADVHTAPTDEYGNPVGWVMHAGTGPLDLAVVVTDMANGEKIAYAGPVMSYYEYVSLNFKRLNDEEWREQFFTLGSTRPAFTGDYLIQNDSFYFDSLTIQGVNEDDPGLPQKTTLGHNYPNPFNAGTTINFTIPVKHANQEVMMEIFNSSGQRVKTLFNHPLPAGNYALHWEGNDDAGNTVSSGHYFYRLSVGGEFKTGQMVMIK